MDPAKRRVLIAIIVYDGQEVVPPCLRSALAERSDTHEIDVLVLDDCSPTPGWSDELAALCEQMGVRYHRNLRNLGIPRNMSLGLLAAERGGFDHVVLCNSDVVLGAEAVGHLATVAETDPTIGSVTAWSNNVSVYSLVTSEGALVPVPAVVDRVDATLWHAFGTDVLDVPTGVGFCMLLPLTAVRAIGRLDPVYGRGYCEEVDWCQRARLAGWRNVLALGTFVFHHGSVSTRAAGIVSATATTDWSNEALVDLRYPDYRDLVAAFLEANQFAPLAEAAVGALVREGLSDGYDLVVGHTPVAGTCVVIRPDGRQVEGHAMGFVAPLEIDASWDALVEATGRPPSLLFVREHGSITPSLQASADAAGVLTDIRAPYPQLV